MKKFSLVFALAIMMAGSSLFAGSVDYLGNQSAKYLMTLNRNASTDASADIAFFNPAGTALLAEGLYLDLSNQTLFKNYETKTAAKTYKQDAPTYALPNLYAVYNLGAMGPGKLAAYGQLGVTGGGGSLMWDDGLPAGLGLVSKAEVTSVYYVFNAGAAYSFMEDMVSLSLGGKVIKSDKNLTANVSDTAPLATLLGIAGGKMSFDFSAIGYTGVIGLDVKPMKELTISAKYELKTALNYKYKDKSDATGTTAGGLFKYVDGMKRRGDLPAVLAFGAEYAVTPELSVSTGFNMYFMPATKQAPANETYKSFEKYYGNGYETGLGVTYKVMPELKIGLGYLYTEQSVKKEYFESSETFLLCAANAPLDSQTFGLGATYSVMPELDLSLTGSYTMYKEEKFPDGAAKGTYNKSVMDIGISVGYKI